MQKQFIYKTGLQEPCVIEKTYNRQQVKQLSKKVIWWSSWLQKHMMVSLPAATTGGPCGISLIFHFLFENIPSNVLVNDWKYCEPVYNSREGL